MSNRRSRKTGLDMMVLLLVALFIFIVGGTMLSSCRTSNDSQTISKEEKQDGIVVAIDAAFGGELTGFEGVMNEADFNEKVVDALEKKLGENNRITVVRTHAAGETASVDEKVEVIRSNKADLVITICCANSNDANKSGMNIYPDIPTNENNENSLKLAEKIQAAFTEGESIPTVQYMYYEPVGGNTYQIKYVGIDDTTDYGMETWRILEKANTTGVVVEQIYITNEEEVSTYANDSGYQKIADKYYKAITSYLGV